MTAVAKPKLLLADGGHRQLVSLGHRPVRHVADPQGSKSLYRKVASLRTAVAKEGAATLQQWGDTLAGSLSTPGAENLACYLALRRRDLSALQPALAALGLSSLGRSEAGVLVALDALLATLARLCGGGAPSYPDPTTLQSASAILQREQERFFGRDPHGPHTRIMATLPTEGSRRPRLRSAAGFGRDNLRADQLCP